MLKIQQTFKDCFFTLKTKSLIEYPLPNWIQKQIQPENSLSLERERRVSDVLGFLNVYENMYLDAMIFHTFLKIKARNLIFDFIQPLRLQNHEIFLMIRYAIIFGFLSFFQTFNQNTLKKAWTKFFYIFDIRVIKIVYVILIYVLTESQIG